MLYRVTFVGKRLVSVLPATDGEADPTNDTILEERTGETLYATVEAADEKEAREKAGRLEVELQTGLTKRTLEGNEPLL